MKARAITVVPKGPFNYVRHLGALPHAVASNLRSRAREQLGQLLEPERLRKTAVFRGPAQAPHLQPAAALTAGTQIPGGSAPTRLARPRRRSG